MMLEPGTIIRGNWSSIEYRVDHCGRHDGYWWINGKAVNNPLQSGHFSYLGKRHGNEVKVVDPNRPEDKLIIIKETRKPPNQTSFLHLL